MGGESFTVEAVAGVYRRQSTRVPDLPRARTDVAGFAGIAGPRRLGETVRIDDWRSFEQTYLADDRGVVGAPPLGSRLAEAVRAFFANGGARCWIANIAESPASLPLAQLIDAMLGLSQRTGLEALLLRPDVAIVVLPELDATVAITEPVVSRLPPLADNGRFLCCPALDVVGDVIDLSAPSEAPLFVPAQILGMQRHVIQRLARDKWRAFAILSTPADTSARDAQAWRDALVDGLDRDGLDCAALYWPWLRVIEKPGAPARARSPVGHMAGIFARRDLALGPHAAPANETIVGAVATDVAVDDALNDRLYATGINPFRAFAGLGVQIWGARTLRWVEPELPLGRPDPLGLINVRRCLSAIERSVEHIGQMFVFEPNGAVLRFGLAQAIAGYLIEVHRAGALVGATPTESFVVRCDDGLNPPDSLAAGRVVCEVGVAIAAAAELLLFRVGRREGVIELAEGTP